MRHYDRVYTIQATDCCLRLYPLSPSFFYRSFEELAILRKQLIDIILKEGVGGLTKFNRMTKKESRDRPKTFYVLISVIFGTGSKY